MRILCINGSFGYQSQTVYEGLILFCHFEPIDTDTTFQKTLRKITSWKPSRLVLVPFTHLHEKAAPKGLAAQMFQRFVTICKTKSNSTLVIVPFGTVKAFHLHAPANNPAIKFIHF